MMKSSVDKPPPERCALPASSLASKTSSFLPFSASSSKAVNASALSNSDSNKKSNPVMDKIYETPIQQ